VRRLSAGTADIAALRPGTAGKGGVPFTGTPSRQIQRIGLLLHAAIQDAEIGTRRQSNVPLALIVRIRTRVGRRQHDEALCLRRHASEVLGEVGDQLPFEYMPRLYFLQTSILY
jgi:hypothetical protein